MSSNVTLTTEPYYIQAIFVSIMMVPLWLAFLAALAAGIRSLKLPGLNGPPNIILRQPLLVVLFKRVPFVHLPNLFRIPGLPRPSERIPVLSISFSILQIIGSHVCGPLLSSFPGPFHGSGNLTTGPYQGQ